jgi:hypothetical protein
LLLPFFDFLFDFPEVLLLFVPELLFVLEPLFAPDDPLLPELPPGVDDAPLWEAPLPVVDPPPGAPV